MISNAFGFREPGMSRLRWPRSITQIRRVRGLSVEQAARLAPDWARVEAPLLRDGDRWAR